VHKDKLIAKSLPATGKKNSSSTNSATFLPRQPGREYLIGNGHDVLVSRGVEVQHVKLVLGVQFVGDSNERSASGLRNTVVDYHHVVVTVSDSGGVVLQCHSK